MIALVGAAHADTLAALHASAFDAPWSAAEIAKLLANPNAFALADESGFVLAWSIADEAEILTVAVAPDARRRGLGRALVASAMGVAAARGASAMLLDVAADNVAARALYAALGFSEVGRRANYYQRVTAAADALLLRRALDGGHPSPGGGKAEP